MGIESIGERAKILLELKKFFYIILNTRDVSIIYIYIYNYKY